MIGEGQISTVLPRRRGRSYSGRVLAWASWAIVIGIAGTSVAQPEGSPGGKVWACQGSDGSTRVETIVQPAPDQRCHGIALPVPGDAVRWATWIPGTLSDDDRIVLSGSEDGKDFAPYGARMVKVGRNEVQRKHLLQGGTALLPFIRLRPFGTEERASMAMREGAVEISCRQGTNAAGMILEFSPKSIQTAEGLFLHWRGDGDPGFTAGVVRPGEPLEGGVRLGRDGSGVIPLPVATEVSNTLDLVVLCPEDAGAFTLLDLRLAAKVANMEPSRAAWMWQPESWRDKPDTLIEKAERLGIQRMFVAVSIDDGGLGSPDAFARFVTQARAHAISVVVVEGDPAMALEAGRATALRRLRALSDYQRIAMPAARFAGIQYDIEPYLLPAYSSDPGGVLHGWAETIASLGKEAETNLDIVLPFWLADDPAAMAVVLPAVASAAKSVTIMAYRTDKAEIEEAAVPFLEWGSSARLPVRIALEAGPVQDEISITYAPAPNGDVLALPAGNGTLVVRLAEWTSRMRGVFAPLHHAKTPAARVSFLGDEAAMMAAARASYPNLAAWPAFAGFAFHGLLP